MMKTTKEFGYEPEIKEGTICFFWEGDEEPDDPTVGRYLDKGLDGEHFDWAGISWVNCRPVTAKEFGYEPEIKEGTICFFWNGDKEPNVPIVGRYLNKCLDGKYFDLAGIRWDHCRPVTAEDLEK
jgi:hypothetical protein